MSPASGYHGAILWVDVAGGASRRETRAENYWRTYAGGGLLATSLLLEHTPPGIDPLGPENLLIFASSVVAGHPGAGLARFTTAAKSPLTGGIGETRTEGPWGIALKASGADAIAIHGAAEDPCYVVVENGRATVHDAADLWGLNVGDTTDALVTRHGADAHVAAIGPAGENRVRFASVVTDRCYQASRMGMGAVLGAKHVKAVVLLPGEAPAPADPATVADLTRRFGERIDGNSLSRWQRDDPGFSCWIYLHGLDAALCVNNYQASTFAGLEAFKEAEYLARAIHPLGCPGCPNDCIKSIQPAAAADLDVRAGGIHQEATGAFGPNLGLGDLDAVLRLNNFCNQQGLDPTSLGFTLSFAMELAARDLLADAAPADRVVFGDAAGVMVLADRIVRRQGLGDLLAEGSRLAARALGPATAPFAMHVKGLELVPFEPRSQTNLALGYAVAPIGPRYDICEHDWDFDTRVGWDHSLDLCRTLGILDRIPMDCQEPRKVRNFKALHVLWSAADALDLCIFAIAPTRLLSLPEMARMLAAVTGWETSDHELMRLGERRLHLMRWYNHREGLGADDDILPERFFTEPIAAGPRQGDCLDRDAFVAAVRLFYAMMGWDEQGVPRPATLYDHGLHWVLPPEQTPP